MNNNRKLGMIAEILEFILCIAILLVINKGFLATLWITLAFVCFAFVSTIVFQLCVWNKMKATKNHVLYIPAITVSSIYLILQIPVCIVFALCSESVFPQLCIMVNLILFVLNWALVIACLAGNDHIQRVNSRHKNHHIEL